jgi:hypothetical protein
MGLCCLGAKNPHVQRHAARAPTMATHRPRKFRRAAAAKAAAQHRNAAAKHAKSIPSPTEFSTGVGVAALTACMTAPAMAGLTVPAMPAKTASRLHRRRGGGPA